jgi:opacity protein-like surface antigen
MGKITVITVLSVVTFAATTFALDVGVGAFYAPGRVFGGATEIEYSGKEFRKGGFKGRVSLGVYEGLNVTLGLGYKDFVYREHTFTYGALYVLSIPMFITTLGADYGFRFGPFSPFAGGGAAIAREKPKFVLGRTLITEWYGGLYVEGGARYFLGGNLAVEAGPRYTHLFDEPVVAYDRFNDRGFVRSEHRSQLIELLFGINYYF